MQARPSRPTSVPDHINAVLTEWAQNPTDTLQNPRKVEAVTATKGGNSILTHVALQ